MIKVGAATEVELKERKAPGGGTHFQPQGPLWRKGLFPAVGVALVRVQRSLEALKPGGDEEVGVNIIRRSLEVPLRLIVQNADREGRPSSWKP